MLSESARMNTAREASFRVEYPNSSPRAIKVIGLDEFSADVVRATELQEAWRNAAFFTGIAANWDPTRPRGMAIHAKLIDTAGSARDLEAEIRAANLVVMISTAYGSAEAAALIAEICSMNRVMITGLLLKTEKASEADLARSLKELRPHAPMLVVSSGEDYVAAMLTALRA